MQITHIRGIDLGLLLVLQALVEERSITRAAQRVFLSQPAMSRALDRLQGLFGDDLLVRKRQGYEPTLRALQLYAELERLLPRLEALVRGNDFDPATATDRFRIAATDFAVGCLFPPVIARLTRIAPQVSLEFHPCDDAVFRNLETNMLDLALWMNSAPRELRTQVLFEDKFACMVRRGHPIGKRAMTLDRYLEYEHAVVTTVRQAQGVLDYFLEERGWIRKVRVKLPYFASAAWMIERSDMVLTLPRQLAVQLARRSDARVVAAPSEIPAFRYIQVWHPRLDTDPAHRWIRELIAEVCAAQYRKSASFARAALGAEHSGPFARIGKQPSKTGPRAPKALIPIAK